MASEAPPFWWEKADWRAWALSPVSWIYGFVAGHRMKGAPGRSVDIAVICVGNFTVGGAGKTPTVVALARAATKRGLKPGILSRGYGGSLDRITVVDPHHHRARDVGDEPLLLAREALTVISRKRVDGAVRLVAEGCDLIIMDDGFQSAQLVMDYALMVVDSRRGIGNGFMIPSGPVRAPIRVQLAKATALLKVGDGNEADPFVRRAARAGKPVYTAAIVPNNGHDLAGGRVLAFCGIADPEKFHRTVLSLGMDLVAHRNFPDHHHLSDDEVADILDRAEKDGLTIVTTAKDHVRLAGQHGRATELMAKATVIDVDMAFDAPQVPGQIIDQAMEAARKRRLREKVSPGNP